MIGAGVGFPLAEACAIPATSPAIAENVSPSAKTKVQRGVSNRFLSSNYTLLDMLGSVRFPAKAVWMCQGLHDRVHALTIRALAPGEA